MKKVIYREPKELIGNILHREEKIGILIKEIKEILK